MLSPLKEERRGMSGERREEKRAYVQSTVDRSRNYGLCILESKGAGKKKIPADKFNVEKYALLIKKTREELKGEEEKP